MQANGKAKYKTNGKVPGTGSRPLLKFNFVRRDVLPQTRIDVRALEMVRSYPLYVKEQEGHEPPVGEVLEQCILNTLSADAEFTAWLSRQDRAALSAEEPNGALSSQAKAAND